MPVLKDNLGMGPADERVVDEKIAAFEAANFKGFVEAEVTPCTGAHLCSDLHSRCSTLVCLGHGCHSGYYTPGCRSGSQGHVTFGITRMAASLSGLIEQYDQAHVGSRNVAWHINAGPAGLHDVLPARSRSIDSKVLAFHFDSHLGRRRSQVAENEAGQSAFHQLNHKP